MHILCEKNGTFLFHFYKDRQLGLKRMREVLFRENGVRAEIVMLLTEIVKNIYDHCPTGEGYLLFLDRKNEIIFSVIEVSDKSVNSSPIARSKWIRKTKKNFGVGLGLIDGIVETFPELILVRSTKKGLSYFGRMRSSKKHPIKT